MRTVLGNQTRLAIQVNHLRELDALLEYMHGRELDALLDGIGRLEWWLESPERLAELVDIMQRARDDQLGI